MSKRLSQIASYLGLKYKEVPIGFRNACEIMRKEKVLIAGEENGGIGFGFYLPERDATLAALLLAEVEANYSGGISGVLKEVSKIVGSSGFSRLNLKVRNSPLSVVEGLKKNTPEKIANQVVLKVSEIDGLKFFLESGDWVNVRVAGTEEILRVYAESETKQQALYIAESVKSIIKKF